MPGTNSNTILYATRLASMPAINIPSGTTTSTYTLVATGAATNGSVITDLLFRSADGSNRNFDVIICATGSNTTAENARVQIIIPASSGNSGSVALASLAALVPQLFDIDLAGNRVIGLEAGQSIYLKSTSTTAGAIFVMVKQRDYTP
jgi:hypothetical protein